MSMPVTEEIACPACGHKQDFVLWQSINVTLDPDLKQKVISRELFKFTCDKCKEQTTIVYPTLYHDMAKLMMIWLALGPGTPDLDLGPMQSMMKGILKHDIMRVVRSHNELVEKLLVFDANLDDRVIEFMKLRLLPGLSEDIPEVGELFFDSLADVEGEKVMNFVALTNSGIHRFSISFGAYEETAKGCERMLPDPNTVLGEPLRVDMDYVRALADGAST